MSEHQSELPDGGDPQLSGLYRAAPAESPPAQIDAAILAAARRAVGARPRATGTSFLRTWRVPLSIAAVLVMSVSMVTLTVRQKSGQPLERLDMPPPVALRSEPVPQAAAPAARIPGTAVGEQTLAGNAKSAAESAAIAPESAEDLRRGVVADAGLATSGKASTTAPGKPDAVAKMASQARQSPSAEAEMAAQTRERSAATSDRTFAVAPSGALPPAAETAAGAEGRPGRRERAESGMSVPAPGVSRQVSVIIKELEKQPAEKWLEQVSVLRQQGRDADADVMLAEFKKRYPNHPMPPALR